MSAPSSAPQQSTEHNDSNTLTMMPSPTMSSWRDRMTPSRKTLKRAGIGAGVTAGLVGLVTAIVFGVRWWRKSSSTA